MAKTKRQLYKIKNWHKYQHYKSRNPPWIKLHTRLLTSQEWVSLDDCDRVLAISCMLIAAHNGIDGTFPADSSYIKRIAYLNQTPNFSKLIEMGFLEEIGEEVLSPTSQTITLSQQKKTRTNKSADYYSKEFEDFWLLYPQRSGGSNKIMAYKNWQERLKEEENVSKILDGTKRYKIYCIATNKQNTEFILDAKNFLGASKDYLRNWEITKNEQTPMARNSSSTVIKSLSDKYTATIDSAAEDTSSFCKNDGNLDTQVDK